MPTDLEKKKLEESKEKVRAAAVESVNKLFDAYTGMIPDLHAAASSLEKVLKRASLLESAIRKDDMMRDISMSRRLYLKLILSTVFTARQHINKMVLKIELCTSSKDVVIHDSDRSSSTFE